MRKLCAFIALLVAATSSFAQNTSCGSGPVIGPTTDITARTAPDAAACGVFVDVQAPQVESGCAVTLTVSGMPAGSVFPVGTTTLVWTARDANNAIETATQLVTVTDTTAPILAAVQDTVVLSTTIPATDALPVPHAADNCGGVIVTATNAGPYLAGDTVVIWTATDESGNTSSAVQKLTVVPAGTITITSATTTRQGRTTTYAPLPIDVRIFDAARLPNLGKKSIDSAWNTLAPLAPPYIQLSGPTLVQVSGGSVYQYTAIVPAGASYVAIARPAGSVENLHERVTVGAAGSVQPATFYVRAR